MKYKFHKKKYHTDVRVELWLGVNLAEMPIFIFAAGASPLDSYCQWPATSQSLSVVGSGRKRCQKSRQPPTIITMKK